MALVELGRYDRNAAHIIVGRLDSEGIDAVAFDDGSRLSFDAECERARRESRRFIRYSYRQPMGTFTGSLPGGIELAHGLGVMEHHDAVW